MRFILDLPPMHSINYSVLSGLNLLNVEDRVAQLRLNHVFNIYQGTAPSYLSEHFLLRSETSSRNTRSSSNLDYIVPRIRTCESGSFFYQGIKNWNELPRHIKEIKGKESFKVNVKKHLMDKGLDKHNCDFHFY